MLDWMQKKDPKDGRQAFLPEVRLERQRRAEGNEDDRHLEDSAALLNAESAEWLRTK
jgi:hypothetical protein